MSQAEFENVQRILAKAAENQKKRKEYQAELLQKIDDSKTKRSWSSSSGRSLSEPMDAA